MKNQKRPSLIPGIDALLALKTHKTLAAAGQVMHLEPSTVWKRIKTLESMIGFDLVRKRGRNTELTPAAVHVLEDAVNAYRDLQDALVRLHQESPDKILIRVGISDSILMSWGPKYFMKVKSKFQNLDFQFSTGPGPSLIQNLKQGDFDLVLSAGRKKSEPGLLDVKLKNESVFYCSSQLTPPKAASLKEANTLYFINQHSLSWDFLESSWKGVLSREGFRGKIIEQDSYAGIASLVAEGWGTGFVPEGLAKLFKLKIYRDLELKRPIHFHFKKGVLRWESVAGWLGDPKVFEDGI